MRNDDGSRRAFLKTLAAAGLSAAVIPHVARATDGDVDAGVVLLKPGNHDYATFRQPFNKRIALVPAVIAVCFNERGVQTAVDYANSRALPMAIKSGGHCFEGYSLNDGGLVIELSRMNRLQLDGQQRLTAGPGAKLAEVFDHLLPAGRLIPTGSCGGVGIAGLTLGGGYGMFSRKYGLTCDSLTGVRMVDGDGKLHDSADRPELLWACRGGGNGNFGIVTGLRFDTQPAPAIFHSVRFKYLDVDAKKAAALAARWFALTPALPPEGFSAFVFSGKTLTVLVTSFAPEIGRALQSDVLANLARDADGAHPLQSDKLNNAVKRYYGHRQPLYFKNVSAGFYRGFDDLKGVAEDLFRRVANQSGMLFQINTFGAGSVTDVTRADSAFPHRAYPYIGELQCYWDAPSQTQPCVVAVKDIQRLLAQHGIRAHYANYPDIDLENWGEAYFGQANYRRLQSIKRLYDPDNRIRHPQSVRPAD